MDEAKMSGTADLTSQDVDLWLMDDSCPYDIYDLDKFPLSKELEEKVRAIADEILGPRDEAQSAA